MDTVDLDALSPQPVSIKFGDQLIEVPPPKVSDLIKLGALATKMGESATGLESELDEAVKALTDHLYKCVPQLEGKPLNLAQISKLVEILSNMAVPAESKELKDRGITVDSPKV